ncbi:MAG TPA: DUF222 domain-containing protein [Acidimicrobiales bacterium]|nr:DUF222 domain-containing protein [Acidimicrobiales bacterium]
MLDHLQGMVKTLDEILSSIEPALLHPHDAVRVLEAASDVGRRADALATLVAARAAEGGEWARQGYRSPEEWLARRTGSSYGQAAGALNASEKLHELAALDDAARKGELSRPQLNELAAAATPDNEKKLLDASKRQNFKQLRKTCAEEKANARSNEREEARAERIHRERYYRSRSDADGAYSFEGKTTAAVGARIEAALDAETDKVFKEARAEGRSEPLGAYRLDALVNLICGGGADVNTTVVVRVDEARLRGEGGICQTPATGNVPVSEAIGAILAGAFVKIVAYDGTDVSRVVHHGRHTPAELKTAILERDGYTCVRPGCGATGTSKSTITKSTTPGEARSPTGTPPPSAPMTTTC